jgi:hypothetical protein
VTFVSRRTPTHYLPALVEVFGGAFTSAGQRAEVGDLPVLPYVGTAHLGRVGNARSDDSATIVDVVREALEVGRERSEVSSRALPKEGEGRAPETTDQSVSVIS